MEPSKSVVTCQPTAYPPSAIPATVKQVYPSVLKNRLLCSCLFTSRPLPKHTNLPGPRRHPSQPVSPGRRSESVFFDGLNLLASGVRDLMSERQERTLPGLGYLSLRPNHGVLGVHDRNGEAVLVVTNVVLGVLVSLGHLLTREVCCRRTAYRKKADHHQDDSHGWMLTPVL